MLIVILRENIIPEESFISCRKTTSRLPCVHFLRNQQVMKMWTNFEPTLC